MHVTCMDLVERTEGERTTKHASVKSERVERLQAEGERSQVWQGQGKGTPCWC
jgi:hypothetical protein